MRRLSRHGKPRTRLASRAARLRPHVPTGLPARAAYGCLCTDRIGDAIGRVTGKVAVRAVSAPDPEVEFRLKPVVLVVDLLVLPRSRCAMWLRSSAPSVRYDRTSTSAPISDVLRGDRSVPRISTAGVRLPPGGTRAGRDPARGPRPAPRPRRRSATRRRMVSLTERVDRLAADVLT